MVAYRRNRVAGGTYFFTVNLNDRQSTLLVDRIDDLRDAIRTVREKHHFHIDAMAVLPDHLHAIWTLPPDDADYAMRWRLIKSRFTKSVADAAEASIWQPRYWEHTIRDDRDFETHVNYVHINPVKHGHVSRASNWKHSSIHRYIREGIVSTNWAAEITEGVFGE